jgi:hypothetical protein
VTQHDALRLFVSFPESLVERPIVYELVTRFDVVPNIRRANVETNSGWIILELAGAHDVCDAAIAYLEELGCTVKVIEATDRLCGRAVLFFWRRLLWKCLLALRDAGGKRLSEGARTTWIAS